MEAARKVEVSTVAVCWGANEKEAMTAEGPDFLIENPSELINCARTFATWDGEPHHYKSIHEM
jgi:phosphoglycolate phosphatase-like HAD superfamily hydrolase